MTREPEGVLSLLTRHVVVPAAMIALVSSFLFYLLEVRGLFFEDTGRFRQVGFCFAVATVLIARYGRVGYVEIEKQGCYTVVLGGATLVFMLQASGPASLVPNLLIVAAVWWFATGVTNALSLESELGEEVIRPSLQVYGVERLRHEDFRRQQQAEKGVAWGMLLLLRKKLRPEVQGNPVVSVTRLVALALLGFALGEPLLLKAAPEVAERALADVVVFLFAAAVVLAAGSTAGGLRQTLAARGRVSPAVLPARIGVAALLAVVVLATALALPGVRFQGQGQPQTTERPGESDQPSSGRSAEAGEGAVPGGGGEMPGPGEGQGDRPAPRPGELGAPSLANDLIESLSGLGKLLRILLLLALPVVALLALLRLSSKGLPWRGLLSRLGAWLRGLLPKRKPRPAAPPGDPFAGLDRLAGLPPRAAILAAYDRLLAALELAGHPRPPRAAPYEYLSALPYRLKPVAATARELTDLYVSVAYGDTEPSEEDRRRALSGLAALAARHEASLHPEPAKPASTHRPSSTRR